MSQPYQFTPVTAPENEQRDYVPLNRCKDKLLIVRPYEYQREGFKTKHQPDGTDVVFADVAVLDEIPPFSDPRYGTNEPGFPAGHQFRRQAILQGFLKGAFKRYLGATLLGTIYFGEAEKGFPPLLWRDLSQHPVAVDRAQKFLIARPEFLIPVEAQIVQSAPVQQTYQQDPWATATPAQPVQEQWANAPVSPAPTPPAARPMTTLEQMRNASATQFGNDEPPF